MFSFSESFGQNYPEVCTKVLEMHFFMTAAEVHLGRSCFET
jgi:hypothetical protein